jgi:succinate dehydrogenase / fumarate reductase, flavoprotein subunit
MHGSNRLGGNSLSDLLVFGQRAGEFAAAYAARLPSPGALNVDEIERQTRAMLAPFERPSGENPYAVHETLRTVMQKYVGIVRSAEDLHEALKEIATLRHRAAAVKVGGNIQYNPGWHLALDLVNMLDVSEAVTRAALERTESRGAHTREEHPDSDAQWGKLNLLVRQTHGGIEIVREPLAEMPAELKQLLGDESHA